MTAPVPISTIRQMLQGDVAGVARKLGLAGQTIKGELVCLNPTRGDRKAGSFRVRLFGAKAGSFVDYAGSNAPFAQGGDRGDVIDLIAYVACGRDRKKAIDWARDHLGIAALSAEEKKRLRDRAEEAKRKHVDSERTREIERKKRAYDMWLRASPAIKGTVAEIYLRAARKIPLDAVKHHSRDLKFAPDLKHWQSGIYFPAIVAAIRNAAGVVTAVHCTFLAPDGTGKAPVDAPKLMFGSVTGGVIRVTNGAGGLSPETAGERGEAGPIIVTEGLEDALSMAAVAPDLRVWAATSLGNLGNVPLDHPCVASCIVVADNDWAKPQAEAALARAIGQLEAHGKPVSVMRSPIGKDANDALRGDE